MENRSAFYKNKESKKQNLKQQQIINLKENCYKTIIKLYVIFLGKYNSTTTRNYAWKSN